MRLYLWIFSSYCSFCPPLLSVQFIRELMLRMHKSKEVSVARSLDSSPWVATGRGVGNPFSLLKGANVLGPKMQGVGL